MAITLTITGANGADLAGDEQQDVLIMGTLNLGSSYATDGVAVAYTDINTALATAGYTAEVSSLDRMVFNDSAGAGATKIAMTYDSANAKVKAHTTACTVNTPGALAATVETGLSPSSHVVTPAGTPLVFLRGQITAGGSTGALNLQDAAPATTLDGHVTQAAGVDTTVTCLAADAATAVTLTFLTWTAGTAAIAGAAEVANATDISAAAYTCEFVALCSK